MSDKEVDRHRMQRSCAFLNIELCCKQGKVKLSQMVPPPDRLNSLVSGSLVKFRNITKFGATHIIQDNFMTTFKAETFCIIFKFFILYIYMLKIALDRMPTDGYNILI